MRLLLLAMMLLLGACSPPSQLLPEERSQIDTIAAFQAAVLFEFGIPSQDKLAELAPLLSDNFNARLQAARDAEERAFARHGGSEPPLVQGSIFHSLFEGAQRIGRIEADPAATAETDALAYLVTLEYGDPTGPVNAIFVWQDRVWLVEQNGSFVVDDVEFLGDWDFSVTGRLSVMLDEIATLE